MKRLIPILSIALLVVACSGEPPRLTKHESHDAAAQKAQIAKRFTEHLWTRDKLLYFRDDVLPTLYAMPLDTSWIIECDVVGLVVTFAEGSTESDPGIYLQLLDDSQNEGECQRNVPYAASYLRRIIASSE
jgi:hypothetical protein